MDFSGVSGAAGWAGAASGRASALELASASGLPGPGTGLMWWPASAFELPGPGAGLMRWLTSTFELPGLGADLMRGLPGPAAPPVNAQPEPAFYGATALTISKFPFDGGIPGMRFSSITALRTTVISSASVLRLIVIFSANLPRMTRFSRMASLRTPPIFLTSFPQTTVFSLSNAYQTPEPSSAPPPRLPPFPAPPFSLSFLSLFPALRPPDPHSFHRPVSAASP